MNFEVRLPRDLDSASEARRAVDRHATHLPEDQVGDVRLLVSELVTNSLRHADLDQEDEIVLALSVGDETIRVEVSDAGPGFEHEVPQGGPPDEPDGWGLYLVHMLSDRWGVIPGAAGGPTRVWFELDRG